MRPMLIALTSVLLLFPWQAALTHKERPDTVTTASGSGTGSEPGPDTNPRRL